MRGAMPPLLHCVFLAWCLVKQRDVTYIGQRRIWCMGKREWYKILFDKFSGKKMALSILTCRWDHSIEMNLCVIGCEDALSLEPSGGLVLHRWWMFLLLKELQFVELWQDMQVGRSVPWLVGYLLNSVFHFAFVAGAWSWPLTSV
jgi:hypothetical protein